MLTGSSSEPSTTMSSALSSIINSSQDSLVPSESRTISPTPSLDDDQSEWSNMSVPQRKQLELSFAVQMNFPINNSWATTERYILSRDQEMLRYLAVYPVNKWLMGSDTAEAAYHAMLRRDKLRSAGTSIFAEGRPHWWPLGPQPRMEPINITASVAAPLEVKTKARNTAKAPKQLKIPRATRPKQPISETLRVDSPLASPNSSTLEKPESGRSTRTQRAPSLKKLEEDRITIEDSSPVPSPDSCPEICPPKKQTTKQNAKQTTKQTTKQTAKQTKSLKFKATAVTVEAPPYRNGMRKSTGADDDVDFPWQVSWSHERPTTWVDSIYNESLLKDVQRVQEHNMTMLANFKAKRKSERDAAKLDEASTETSGEDGQLEDEQKAFRRKSIQRPLAGTAIRSVQLTNQAASKLAARMTFEQPDVARTCGFDDVEAAIELTLRNPFNDFAEECFVRNEIGETTISGLKAPLLTAGVVARTRVQLESSRVLTDRAAERMIDFCPSMLTDYKLLQVLGETSLTNAAIQRRLAMNGIIVCDSTITKRVSAALARPCEMLHESVSEATRNEMKALYRSEFHKYQEYHRQRRAQSKEELSSNFETDGGTVVELRKASERYTALAMARAQEAAVAAAAAAANTKSGSSMTTPATDPGSHRLYYGKYTSRKRKWASQDEGGGKP